MEKGCKEVKISESIHGQFTEGRVDQKNRIISGVLIMNATTRNPYFKGSKGTKFSESFLNDIVEALDGSKCYLDHVSDEELKKNRGVRSVSDLIGIYENAHVHDGLPRADIKYYKHKAELVESLMEHPDQVGLSIVASGKMSYNQSTKIAEAYSLIKLSSVDMVASPGSTSNMFESASGEKPDDLETQMLEAAKSSDNLPGKYCTVIPELTDEELETKMVEAARKPGDNPKKVYHG